MECLACGPTPSQASREHVFAQWLLKRFGSMNLQMGLSRKLPDGTTQPLREEYRLDSFKLKKICTACNGGWMSKLEESAKPIIVALIDGGRDLTSLTAEQRCTLARWVGKTAVIESHAVGAESPVNPAFLRQIKLDLPDDPGRFAVAGSHTTFEGFVHIQVGVIRDLIGGGIAAGNVIMIALPRLAFVCAFPMLNLRFQCRVAAPLQGIWPCDARLWQPVNDVFQPIALNTNDSLINLAGRIELFHHLV